MSAMALIVRRARLVTPPLVNPHVHLDKARLAARSGDP
jgi:cytosine/adenosine deaminase-related metal-dependent hydrolase